MTDSASQPGIDIPYIKNQLNQLKGLFDSGALKADAYQEAKEALERKLVDWALLQGPVDQAAAASTPDVTAVVGDAPSTSTVAVEDEQAGEKPRGSWPKVAAVLALADVDVDLAHSHVHGLPARGYAGHLCGVRGSLA